MTKKLDWVPRFDERSKEFRVAAVHTDTRACDWRHGVVLDQGNEGACVGFAATGNLMSTKRPVSLIHPDLVAMAVYHYAQTVDEWDGVNYSGTSVLAGMKALKHHGYVSRYEWCLGAQDVLWALSWRGPVQLGINWYEGMWNPDADGFLHVTGNVVGGHSILVSGINPDQKYVTVTNSWGEKWGDHGQARISFDDLSLLLDRDKGEAVSVVKVKTAPAEEDTPDAP